MVVYVCVYFIHILITGGQFKQLRREKWRVGARDHNESMDDLEVGAEHSSLAQGEHNAFLSTLKVKKSTYKWYVIQQCS